METLNGSRHIMIYIVTHHDFASTVWELKRRAQRADLRFVRPISYRRLFRSLRAPVGHYIFTDFDRLSAYEVQVADVVAQSILKEEPEARVLNRPALVLERYPLLKRLKDDGLNDFSVYRLDSNETPRRYPVFIRCEDDCREPDTPLLNSPEELSEAVRLLTQSGISMKRRIAVELCAQRGADGFYRKYGVFKVGDHLIPHHLHRGADWYVKRYFRDRTKDPEFEAEETRFIRDIPHAEQINRVFAISNIDFGRIDYSIVNGKVQTYEINTNPTVPPLSPNRGKNASPERRALIRERMLKALREIDTPMGGASQVRFDLPTPQMQKFDPLPVRARFAGFYQRFRLITGL